MTDQVKFVASAKRVIDAEAAALTTLSTSLGPSFGEAVALLLNAKGRVIVSGMGKSGHIARDLPPEAPSFIMRVCGFGFHILHRHFGQARRVRSPQFAQAHGALQRVFGFRVMSAV
jgi:hypothetical protein